MAKTRLTFDPEASCGYLEFYPNAMGEPVRTVEVVPNQVLVDVTEDGRISGVETIGGPVDLAALGEVLRWVRCRPVEPVTETEASDG